MLKESSLPKKHKIEKKEGTNYSRKNTAEINSKHISELGNKNGHRYDDWNYDWIIIDSRF